MATESPLSVEIDVVEAAEMVDRMLTHLWDQKVGLQVTYQVVNLSRYRFKTQRVLHEPGDLVKAAQPMPSAVGFREAIVGSYTMPKESGFAMRSAFSFSPDGSGRTFLFGGFFNQRDQAQNWASLFSSHGVNVGDVSNADLGSFVGTAPPGWDVNPRHGDVWPKFGTILPGLKAFSDQPYNPATRGSWKTWTTHDMTYRWACAFNNETDVKRWIVRLLISDSHEPVSDGTIRDLQKFGFVYDPFGQS